MAGTPKGIQLLGGSRPPPSNDVGFHSVTWKDGTSEEQTDITRSTSCGRRVSERMYGTLSAMHSVMSGGGVMCLTAKDQNKHIEKHHLT